MACTFIEELSKLIEPVMVVASFDVAEPILTFNLSIPFEKFFVKYL